VAQYEKKTAYKINIGDLIKGKFVKREGWEPSYIVGKDGLEISRVNLIGMAIGLEQSGTPSLVLDDGTGRIEARAFGDSDPFTSIDVGTLTLVIGRPREYGGEIFVSPEIVKPLPDTKWAEVRRKELAGVSLVVDKTEITEPETPEPTEAPEEVKEESLEDPAEETPPSQIIYNLIKELDTGDGAEVDSLIKKADLKDTEKIISSLLMEGDIFEVRNGRLKVLE
jgi:hypothetical protein